MEPVRGARARRLQQALAVCDPLTLLAGCELSYTERSGDDTAVPSFVFYSNVNEYVVTTPSYITSVTFLATTHHAADVELKLEGSIAMEAGASRSICTQTEPSIHVLKVQTVGWTPQWWARTRSVRPRVSRVGQATRKTFRSP